jgi:hypothetical protein
VHAIAAGTIKVELPEKARNEDIRIAPSFIATPRLSTTSESGADSAPHRFNPLSVAKFLGKAKKKGAGFEASETVRAVIDALELCELGVLKRDEIDGIPTCS